MNIFYPLVIIYAVGTQKNRLIDNICFGLEFEIILGVHNSHLLLICSSELPGLNSHFLTGTPIF